MSHRKLMAVLVGMLGIATLVVLLWPRASTVAPVQGQSAEDELRLTGIVRDFHEAHPDFQPAPTSGVGHYAGCVGLSLPVGGRPELAPGGYRVDAEWTDSTGRPIAPHLFGVGGAGGGAASGGWVEGTCAGVHVTESLELKTGAIVDAFDPGAGDYGPGNGLAPTLVSTGATGPGAVKVGSGCTIHGDVLVGPGGDPAAVVEASGTITGEIGVLETTVAQPPVVVPDDSVVGPVIGDVWYQNDDVVTLDANLHTDDFRISTRAVVTISGHVTVVVEGNFTTETDGSLVVPDGSSLDIYVKGKAQVKTKSRWSNPHHTRLYAIGDDVLKIETESSFYGTLIAPDRLLALKTRAGLHGAYFGRALLAETDSGLHVVACGSPGCVAVNDSVGVAGMAGTGGISSAVSFDQWFRDVPGVNMSRAHTVTLTLGAGGVYEYLDDAFHPIDGLLFGNEGDPYNHYLSYAISGSFVYGGCGSGQFIDFRGGDGAWLFIDDELVIDLGGFAPPSGQHVELDRLGLTEGVEHAFKLFYAQRRPNSSVFRLRTNVPLTTDGTVPTFTEMYD